VAIGSSTTKEQTMPKLDAVAIGNPCWADVMTSDKPATRAFYAELLGWDAEEPNEEFGGYFNFTKDGGPIAGAMDNQGGGMPDVWSIYLAVADAEATCEAVKKAGGSVMVEPMAVGTLGSMAVVIDPTGAVIGMWQPGDHKGFAAIAEPGAPGWFELFTKDFEVSRAFYTDAFGWDLHTVSDEDDFRYMTLHDGDDQAAGIMDAAGFLPDEVPPHWSVYFAVEDVDTTLAKAAELGGTVEAPAEDTPYGRLATLADPTGARFKVMGPNVSGEGS
jgi:predicted enzyme related to lactoylglutathione lyase